MNLPLSTVAGLFAVLLVSCNERPKPGASAAAEAPVPKHEASLPLEHKWPPQAPFKVVAYRFVNPLGPGDGNFTLIKDSGVDLEKLKSMTVASAELNAKQAARLVDFIIGKHPKVSSAACYDPHHIFVFYNARGEVENAVEICFGCTSVITLPDVGEKQWYHYDFRGLARLCEEAGIGMQRGTAADFIAKMDEREREFGPSAKDEEDDDDGR